VQVTEHRATVAVPSQDPEGTATQLHQGLREATGVAVLLAAVVVEDEGPRHAHEGAQLLADLAGERGWTDRPVLVDDLLVPYLVARVPEVRRRARAARDRLAEGPDLLETVVAWFGHDFDRRETAAALHVHPNTLDHRLRRISERLEVDLSTSAGVELASTIAALGPA
jgi:sugar diacid utilization regulator